MILVYKNDEVKDKYFDFISEDIINADYPDAYLLKTTCVVNWNANNAISETQEAGFSDETGLEWNGSAWVLSDTRKKLMNIDRAKHVARLKLADIDNPVTGTKMSLNTTKEAIERDLEHNSINLTMIGQQPSTDALIKAAIESAQQQGIAILLASKQIYAAISANTDYDYVNSPLWP